MFLQRHLILNRYPCYLLDLYLVLRQQGLKNIPMLALAQNITRNPARTLRGSHHGYAALPASVYQRVQPARNLYAAVDNGRSFVNIEAAIFILVNPIT